MDALAVSYAAELNRWGIETSIIVPGAFTSGTNHFANAGAPADKERQIEYDNGPYAHLGEDIMKGLEATAPTDADVADVARAIVEVADMPFGKRPFRFMSIPRRMAPKLSTASQIASVPRCTTRSALRICSHLLSRRFDPRHSRLSHLILRCDLVETYRGSGVHESGESRIRDVWSSA
jgi:hypothetical protein